MCREVLDTECSVLRHTQGSDSRLAPWPLDLAPLIQPPRTTHRIAGGWIDETIVSLLLVGGYMCCQRVHMRDWEFSDSRKVSLGVGSKVGGDSFLRQFSRDPIGLRGHRGFILCELRRVIVLYRLLSRHCVAYQRRCTNPIYHGLRFRWEDFAMLSRPCGSQSIWQLQWHRTLWQTCYTNRGLLLEEV
jgi:hypothetical protein